MLEKSVYNNSTQCPVEKPASVQKSSSPTISQPVIHNNADNLGYGIGRALYSIAEKTYNAFNHYWYPPKLITPKEIRLKSQKLRYINYIDALNKGITAVKNNPLDSSKLKQLANIIKDHFKEKDFFDKNQRSKQVLETRELLKSVLNNEQQEFLFTQINYLYPNRLATEEIKEFQSGCAKEMDIGYLPLLQKAFNERISIPEVGKIKKEADLTRSRLKNVIQNGIKTRVFRDTLCNKNNKLTIWVNPTSESAATGRYHIDTHTIVIDFPYPSHIDDKNKGNFFYSILVNELFSAAILNANHKKKLSHAPLLPLTEDPEKDKTYALMAEKFHSAVLAVNQRLKDAKIFLEKTASTKNNHQLTSEEEKQWREIENALRDYKSPLAHYNNPAQGLYLFLEEWEAFQQIILTGQPYKELPQPTKDHEYISFFESYPSETKQYFFKEICDLLSEFHNVDEYCNHENPSFMMRK